MGLDMPAAALDGGFNFIVVSLPVTRPDSTNEPIITVAGKTLAKSPGVEPDMTIMGNALGPGDFQWPTDEDLVCEFTYELALAEGLNQVAVISDNGVKAEETFEFTRATVVASCDITIQRNQAGGYSTSPYLPAGVHNVKITTDYDLTQAPVCTASRGALAAFGGSGKVWVATLTIAGGDDGTWAFANAQLVNAAGTGTVINSGAAYYVDAVAPAMQSANFGSAGTVVWHSPDGSVTFEILCGESTVGWTGQVDLSAFGQSADAALTPSGTSMIRTFTPAKADVAATSALNMRVFDRAGNPASNNGVSSGSNMLQTVAYSIPAEVLNFAIGSYDSDPLAGGKTFTNPAWVHVEWGPGWMQSGTLASGWSIINNNAIRLDGSYASSVANNTDGSMCVNVWED